MSDLYKHPQTTPQDEKLESRNNDMQDWGGSHMETAGPAGSNILTNSNERGILQAGLFRVIDMHQVAELGSTHDQHRQGIYASDSKYSE